MSIIIKLNQILGEQKAFIFGVLAFISVGAILGACVCCRRRKRGFEVHLCLHLTFVNHFNIKNKIKIRGDRAISEIEIVVAFLVSFCCSIFILSILLFVNFLCFIS